MALTFDSKEFGQTVVNSNCPPVNYSDEWILREKIHDYIIYTSLVIIGILLVYAIYNSIKLFISRKESKEIKKKFLKRLFFSFLLMLIVFFSYSIVCYVVFKFFFDKVEMY